MLSLWLIGPGCCSKRVAWQVREIWLSSEDTGAYGRDLGTSLPELLRALVAALPADGRTMLRIGMTNPPFILEHLPAIAEVPVHARFLTVELLSSDC